METPLLDEMRVYLKPLGVNLDTAIPKGLQRSIDSAMLSARQHSRPFLADGWLALRRSCRRRFTVLTMRFRRATMPRVP